MKVIRKSNYDHEDWRRNQYFVELTIRSNTETKTRTLTHRDAQELADCLNNLAGERSDHFYCVVSDDYVLPTDWEP